MPRAEGKCTAVLQCSAKKIYLRQWLWLQKQKISRKKNCALVGKIYVIKLHKKPPCHIVLWLSREGSWWDVKNSYFHNQELPYVYPVITSLTESSPGSIYTLCCVMLFFHYMAKENPILRNWFPELYFIWKWSLLSVTYYILIETKC